jgi:DedD protein
MGLFSFFRKNQQESGPDDSGSYSHAEESAAPARSRNRRKQPSESRAKSDGQRTDPVLPEKKRARRRLVGSVALVLALIIGLPMVLDAGPKPLEDDIAIQIPSKDAPENRRPVRQPSPSSGELMPGVDPGEEIIELPPLPRQAPLNAKNESVPLVAAKKAEAAVAPVPSKPAIDRVSVRTSAEKQTISDSREDRQAQSAAGNEPDGRKPVVPASSEAKRDDAESSAEKKSQKIVLQVAALATAGKANELQSRLASAGVRSYTQKVTTESGTRIRIRTGPYTSKDEADKVRAKLVLLGLSGTVVSN